MLGRAYEDSVVDVDEPFVRPVVLPSGFFGFYDPETGSVEVLSSVDLSFSIRTQLHPPAEPPADVRESYSGLVRI